MDVNIAASLKKSGVRVGKRGAPQAFAARLFDILANEPDDVIGWNAAGTVFFIRDPESFSEEILTKYYRHNKLTSFQRQLNLYHFRKLSKGVDAGGYTHDCFRRDKPELLYRVRRAVAGQPLPKAWSFDEEDDSSSSSYSAPSSSSSSSSSRGGSSKGSRRKGGSGGSEKTRSSKKTKGNLPPVKAAVPLVLKAKKIIREASGTSRAFRSSKPDLLSSPSSTPPTAPTPSSSPAASRPSSPVPTSSLPRFGITLPSLHQREAELIRRQQLRQQEMQALQLRKQHEQQEIELIQRLRQHQQQQQEELKRKLQQQALASFSPDADSFTAGSLPTSTKASSLSAAAAAAAVAAASPPPLSLPEDAWSEPCDGALGSRKRVYTHTPMTELPTPATSSSPSTARTSSSSPVRSPIGFPATPFAFVNGGEKSGGSGFVNEERRRSGVTFDATPDDAVRHEPSYLSGLVDGDGSSDGGMSPLNYYHHNSYNSFSSSSSSSNDNSNKIDDYENGGGVSSGAWGGQEDGQTLGGPQRRPSLTSSVTSSSSHASAFDLDGFDVEEYEAEQREMEGQGMAMMDVSGVGGMMDQLAGMVQEADLLRDDYNSNINNCNNHNSNINNSNSFNGALATFAPSSYYSAATSSTLPTSSAVRSSSSSSYLSLGSLAGMEMMRQSSYELDAAFLGEATIGFAGGEELALDELASLLCEE